MTFEGPRIRNIEIYVLDAWQEYGIRAFQLMTWTFEEEETIESVWDNEAPPKGDGHPVAAPPHHRF